MSETTLAQRYVNMLIATNKDPELRFDALMEFAPHVVDTFFHQDFFMVALDDMSFAYSLSHEAMYVESTEEAIAYLTYLQGKSPAVYQALMAHMEAVAEERYAAE